MLFASLMIVEKALKMLPPILGCSACAHAPPADTHHRGQHGEEARVLTRLTDWRGTASQQVKLVARARGRF